jgi:aminopeptidase N
MRQLQYLCYLVFIALPYCAFSQNIEELKTISQQEAAVHQRVQLQSSQMTQFTTTSDAFDVKYYRCEWTIDPAVRYISGKVTVYYVAKTSINSISLDLMNNLSVTEVKQRSSVLTKQHLNNVLTINLPVSLGAGTLDSLSITYQGSPGPDTGFGAFKNNTHNGAAGMWTLSEPYGSREWWPCKNGLEDKADSIDVFVTHPSIYKASSNGLLKSETVLAGGKTRTYWKHRYPIASYLVCLAVTNYSVFSINVQLGNKYLPIQTFAYPESLASFQQGTLNTLFAMALYHQKFGDYPFINEKYGHTQFGWGGGMEHQTNSFMINLSESLVAHELAHQWFGDKITCGSWEDIWLNEGFATHLASFYNENKYGQINWDSMIMNRKSVVDYITSLPDGSVKVSDTTDVGRIFNSRLTYQKGSYLLYMLRWKLGDDIFFKAIQQYQKDPKLIYGFARTTDLKRNLEQVSGVDLTEFFKDWYEGQGYPSYQVQWSPVGLDHVRIKLNQTTSHPSVDFFELPLALKFSNASQSKTIVLDNKINGEVFIKKLGFIPTTVVVDPEYWLITKNNTTQKVSDDLNPENFVKIYPNPIGDQFSVYLRNFSSAETTLSIYTMQGKLIQKELPVLVEKSGVAVINSQQWAKGTYILKISSGGVKQSFKLIK